MIHAETLYGLTVSKTGSTYELLAASTEDPRATSGRWRLESSEKITATLSRLDMSAIDYIGVDQRLRTASSVQVGHPIRGSMLLEVFGAAE